MSDLERLHEIIDSLPQDEIHALLTLLDRGQSISDEMTAASILAAERETGELLSHAELKRQLGL